MYPAYLRGVPPTPASVPRTPLPAATSGAKAYGPGLVAAEVGCAATFTVETLDPYDERRRSGGDVVVARLMVGSEVTVEAFSLDNQDGSFQCTYVPKSVDHRQKLHVTVNGIPVRGSPFRPELSSGPVAAKACTASGPELYDSVAGVPTTIMVQARDCFGNPLRSGGHSFKMHVCAVAPNRSEYLEKFRTFEFVAHSDDLGDGTYAIQWSADIPGGCEWLATSTSTSTSSLHAVTRATSGHIANLLSSSRLEPMHASSDTSLPPIRASVRSSLSLDRPFRDVLLQTTCT